MSVLAERFSSVRECSSVFVVDAAVDDDFLLAPVDGFVTVVAFRGTEQVVDVGVVATEIRREQFRPIETTLAIGRVQDCIEAGRRIQRSDADQQSAVCPGAFAKVGDRAQAFSCLLLSVARSPSSVALAGRPTMAAP